MSQTHSQTYSYFPIYPLYVDRFGRSMWFCLLEFDKEAIADGLMSHIRVFIVWREGSVDLVDLVLTTTTTELWTTTIYHYNR